jgi:hypothetical protein
MSRKNLTQMLRTFRHESGPLMLKEPLRVPEGPFYNVEEPFVMRGATMLRPFVARSGAFLLNLFLLDGKVSTQCRAFRRASEGHPFTMRTFRHESEGPFHC